MTPTACIGNFVPTLIVELPDDIQTDSCDMLQLLLLVYVSDWLTLDTACMQ